MTTPSVEHRAKLSNQISAMQQARKLHSLDWIVLMRLIGEVLTLLDTLSQSLTEAQGEIERLKEEAQRYAFAFGGESYKHPEAAARTVLETELGNLTRRAEQAESTLAAMREERDQLKDENEMLLTRTGELVTLPSERATAPTDKALSKNTGNA